MTNFYVLAPKFFHPILPYTPSLPIPTQHPRLSGAWKSNPVGHHLRGQGPRYLPTTNGRNEP